MSADRKETIHYHRSHDWRLRNTQKGYICLDCHLETDKFTKELPRCHLKKFIPEENGGWITEETKEIWVSEPNVNASDLGDICD